MDELSPNHGRRMRLREFQTQLIDRMRIARSGAAQPVSQLGVDIGGQRWLLNLQHAGEVITPGAISPVPLTQDWFLGLINVRGNLLSVSDFARFQGLPATQIDKASRVIAFAPGLALHGALLVSRVLGLRSVAAMTPHSTSAADAAPWAAARFLDREEQVWTQLDLSVLAQDARFLNVGR